MKKLKKLLSIVLAVAMVLSLVVVTSADDGDTTSTTYTITINDSTSGYEYTAYQIFKGDYDSESGVLSNIEWGSDITSDDKAELYSALAAIQDSNGNYPFTSGGGALTSAEAVASVLSGCNSDDDVVKAFAEVVAQSTYLTGTGTEATWSDTDSKYTISDLSAGYYLIRNTSVPNGDAAYTSYILEVVKSTTVTPKRDLPKVDKDIVEANEDAGIGDTITYYLTASLPSNLEDYDTYLLKFTDTLGSGLTYVGVSAVYVYTSTTDAADHTEDNRTLVWADDTNYKVNATGVNTDGGGSFTVTLEDVLTLTADSDGSEGSTISVTKDSLIQVVFTATLNSNAVTTSAGNPNEVYLEYSNNPNGEGTGKTEKDTVITWTYELDVTKVDGDTTDDEVATKYLEATFELYKEENSTKYYVTVDDNGKVTGWTTAEDSASKLTSDKIDGIFKVIGLDVGTYYLEEVTEPSGYNKLTEPVKITISATHTYESSTWLTDDATSIGEVTVSNNASYTDNVVSTTVKNYQGSSLPSTGGIGTTIFYVVGGVLVLGAVVLLITRKRMGKEEK